jgi:ADP-heptose:LPS heptosyltransferase
MRIKLPSDERILYVANILANKLLFRQKVRHAPGSILVVKWDEIGDMATSTHVFASLKASYPDAELTVLCKPFVKDLVLHDPHINHILTGIDEYNKAYELVVELRGTWKTLWKSIRYKAIYRVSRAETRLRNKGRQLHEIDSNLEIIRPVLQEGKERFAPVLYYSEAGAARVRDFLEKHGIEKFALIHAGARRKLRQWNLDRFALAAQYLHERYGFEIIFAGSPEDRQDIETIRSYLSFKTYDFTEGFSL